MKNKIKTLLLTLAIAGAAQFCFAQNYVHRVIILNEGHYDYVNSIQTVPVTLGVYNPATGVYNQVAVINNARFATYVITDGSSIYAAADSFLIRYDIDTYQVLATATLPGIRRLAVWNNQLLVTRGEYLVTFNSYLSVYDKNTLQPVYSLPALANTGPQYASEGIAVKNDKAYIAVNNGFEWGNEKGLIGILDLQTQTYLSEVDLGPTGKNPYYIATLNNQLFTLNNRDFTASSISALDLSSSNVTTVDLGINNGCGGSVLAMNDILYQQSGGFDVGKFSTSSMTNTGTLGINKNIYGMAHDEVNNLIYVGETDFTSWGKIFIYQPNGTVIDSFDVDVAPGNIAFDIRDAASVNENEFENSFSLYPNPANNQLSVISYQQGKFSIDIYDALGQHVFSQQPAASSQQLLIDISDLNPGVYMLSVKADGKSFSKKIVKY